MKMMYNGTPIKSLNVKHYEVSTNDCTMKASDLQAGVTGVARGKKIVGTGKAFSFAFYGDVSTNDPLILPSDLNVSDLNVIEIACGEYPIQHLIQLKNMKDIDFTTNQNVANIVADNNSYQIIVNVTDNVLNINCDKTTTLQVFCGKDEYV